MVPRRSALALALAVASSSLLAPPAQAAPKAGGWKSTKVERGYSLKFTVGKGVVRKFSGSVLETCSGESTSSTTTVSVAKPMRIKGGKFSITEKVTSGGVTVITTVKGRFTGAGKAVGTVRAQSIVAGATCDTYVLDWSAKKA